MCTSSRSRNKSTLQQSEESRIWNKEMNFITRTEWMTLGSDAFIHLILCSSNFISFLLAWPTNWLSPPPHRNHLCFVLALINISMNKKQILSGKNPIMNEFWLFGKRNAFCSLTTYEHFSFDNKDVLKNLPFLVLLAGCNHTAERNAINRKSEMRNCKGDQANDAPRVCSILRHIDSVHQPKPGNKNSINISKL